MYEPNRTHPIHLSAYDCQGIIPSLQNNNILAMGEINALGAVTCQAFRSRPSRLAANAFYLGHSRRVSLLRNKTEDKPKRFLLTR